MLNKIMYTLLYFLKTIVFKNKNSYNFSSREFNVRQFITFFLMVFLLVANFILAKRSSILSERLEDRNKDLAVCHAKCPDWKIKP